VTPEPSVGPTSSACLEELLARGVTAVRQAAAFALDPGEELRIEAKAHRNDLVTQVDRGVEERIGRAFSADERVQLCELLRCVGAALEESDLPANVATLKSDPDD